MGLTITYTGWRPYAEVKVDGVRFGFSRGQSRDDIPEEFIRRKILPAIENGATLWTVEGLKDEKTEAMKEVVKDTVEDASESVDYTKMTRAQLMKAAKELGLQVNTSDKKADLLSRIQEHLA